MYGSDYTATGVSTHSEPNKNYFICSVDRASNSEATNATLRSSFTNTLKAKNITFKTLEGFVNGVKEVSYLIDQKYYPSYKQILKSYDQETVLLLDNYKHGLYKATLDFVQTGSLIKDSKKEFIGYLRSVPKEVALKEQAWSYDEETDNYFIVTESDDTTLDGMYKLGYSK